MCVCVSAASSTQDSRSSQEQARRRDGILRRAVTLYTDAIGFASSETASTGQDEQDRSPLVGLHFGRGVAHWHMEHADEAAADFAAGVL